MIDPRQIKTVLIETFNHPIAALKISPLFGDASSRIYYRLNWQEESHARSAILMAMADTAGAKLSTEIGSGGRSEINELPFINIQKHLTGCKISVPEIYAYRDSLGWLLLEDLGDMSLHAHLDLSAENPQALLDVYKNAIEVLVNMQHKASPSSTQPTIAHLRHFDSELFLWEFEHFIEYGIEHRTDFAHEQHTGTPLSTAKRATLLAHFSEIAKRLGALPQVFVHRDYHSRNLMIQDEAGRIKIRIIDFQDALMGPAEYDLASLLRDSYIALPAEVIDELLAYYIETVQQTSGKTIDASDFRESFDLISIQRNLKAAGRFIFIDKIKKKDHLLPYVSPTLYKVKQTLLTYPHLKPLYELLSAHVPELR